MKRSQTVLGLFSESTAEYFARCHETAVRLCLEKGHANPDDVQLFHPRPQYVHKNSMSRLFPKSMFVRIDTTQSERPGAKKHYIGVYKLRAQYERERAVLGD